MDTKSTIEKLNRYNLSKIIELGCGTGKNINYLFKKADMIIGLDFSQEMLNKAKAKIQDERVKFLKANLTAGWSIENDGTKGTLILSYSAQHNQNDELIKQIKNQ